MFMKEHREDVSAENGEESAGEQSKDEDEDELIIISLACLRNQIRLSVVRKYSRTLGAL